MQMRSGTGSNCSDTRAKRWCADGRAPVDPRLIWILFDGQESVDKFHSVKWRRGWRVGFRSLARSKTLFHSAGRSWRRGEVYQSSPSPAPRRSDYVYPSPFALPSLSFSPSLPLHSPPPLAVLLARQPFPPLATPGLCSVLRGKLLRGASLFWLPYFTDSKRPPCSSYYLPFYPFSSLSLHPPFRKFPHPSLSSRVPGPLSLYSRYTLGPSCFTPTCYA